MKYSIVVSRINFQQEVKKEENLSRYISGYSTPEKPQEIDEIQGDFQLTGLLPAINSYASRYSKITILDIGCGNGILLAKLASADFFKNKSNIQYIGSDYRDKLKKAFSTALDLNCLSESKFISLEDDNWTKYLNENSIVVVRNVFHELKISEAAKIMYQICTYLPTNSVVFIQDMTTLPTAEKGNAGWLGIHFKSILEQGGLNVVFTPDTSKRGIDLFLIEATRKEKCGLSENNFHKLLLKSRKEQVELLTKEHDKTAESPDNELKLCRIYHDITAISLDLKKYENINDEIALESIFNLAFKSLSEIDIQNITDRYEYPRIRGFQNRGHHIDSINDFLRSDKSIYILKAGSYLGKKTLVWWALDQKLRHERLPLYLFLNESSNVSTILEEIAIQIGVTKFLDVEILTSLHRISLDVLKNSMELRSALLLIVKKSILILDGFENCIDPNNKIQNADVSWLVNFWSDIKGAKIIIQTRVEVKDIPFSKSTQEYMSTFPKTYNDEYKFTKQLLDELIPISYRTENIGFKRYPENLLVTLDNHPYFIYVAGTLIRNSQDFACLTNQDYLSKLENRLYDTLISEFNLGENQKLAIYSLGLIQIPVPTEFVEMLCGEKIAIELLEKGFLVQEIPGRFRLLTILTKIRIEKHGKEEIQLLETNLHKKISSLFYDLYKNNSDPSFLRQAYHHQLLSGNKKISTYILPQLSEAAEFWFSNHKYSECIWAYETIQKERKLHSREQLRFASCLIRTQKITEGMKEYNELIKKYNTWKGVKSSYVDSLIYAGVHIKTALKVLDQIPEHDRDTYWHRQKARCYIQINKRMDAYSEYETAILGSKKYESWNIIRELIAYAHKVGDDDKEYEWLDYAWTHLMLHIDEVRIELGAYYERMNQLEKAEELLFEAYKNMPNNAYCVLPLVKTLYKVGKVDEAEAVMQSSKNAKPNEVIEYTKIFLLKGKKDFPKCKELLEKSLFNIDHSLKIHRWGQWADLFYSWCQEFEGEVKIEMAREGLKYVNEIIKEKNVPAMMACLELAQITEDKALIGTIEENILKVNDSFRL